jgi:hypothetical protein
VQVCEHHKRGFDPALLSETFGYQTLGNGLVAGTYTYTHIKYINIQSRDPTAL